MDRSFLADEHVIAASRKFVCIRLATYEDADENKILANIFSRQGVLENTVFALLTPDGKTKLVAAGRSPVWAFGGVNGPGVNAQPKESIQKMSATMEAIALAYPGKGKNVAGPLPLPYLADMRLALNVSAADRQPLVAVFSEDAKERKKMERELSQLAWTDTFIGQTQYVVSQKPNEFKTVEGFKPESGFIVIQPGTFGLTGQVIDVIPANTSAKQLSTSLANALKRHQPNQLTYDQHRRAGTQAGARWESKTTNQEKERGRSGRQRGR